MPAVQLASTAPVILTQVRQELTVAPAWPRSRSRGRRLRMRLEVCMLLG